ncbi:MAG: leucine-rich repeat domain-containing protein, partial [Candidatus Hodarchaeota archaeon]
MSIKLVKDTLVLSEFGSQRFLFGNFVPAIYLILSITFLITERLPLTVDEFPILTLLITCSLVLAFFSSRISRAIICNVCALENKYQIYLKKCQLKKRFSKNREQNTTRLIHYLLISFKKSYHEYYYSPSLNREMEDLRRYETLFIFGWWIFLYSLIIFFGSLIYKMEIPLALRPSDCLHFLTSFIPPSINISLFFIPLIILGWGLFAYERKNIATQTLEALPLPLRCADFDIEDRFEALEELLSAENMTSDERKALQNEIRQKNLYKLKEKIVSKRIRRIIQEEQEKEDAEAIEEVMEVAKRYSKPIAITEAGKLDKLMDDLPPTEISSPRYSVDEKGRLISLDLSGMRLKDFSKSIRQFTQLQELSLDGNQLTTLPPEIGQLTQLQTLRLAKNYFKTLPPEISQLLQLQTLSLFENHFTTLPPEISQLPQLQTLRLAGNQLTTLPNEISQLPQLQILDLTRNQLTTLPPEIGQLSQLQILSLDENQ